MTTTIPLTVRPTGPRIGAEVAGTDLRGPVEEPVAHALREALCRHRVLVFREQHLDPHQHVAAVSIFGEPFDHPTALRHPENPLVYPCRVDRAATRATSGGR